MPYIPKKQPKRTEKIRILHNKANSLMDESRLIQQNMDKTIKEIGKTRPNTKKISNLKKKYSNQNKKRNSKQHELKETLYQKDKLLGHTMKKGYKKLFE